MSKVKLLMIILSLFTYFACSETQDAYYNNIDDAIKQSAVEKGWIPDILPKSSYEIYERHDLDTNTVWLRFKFDKRDISKLISQITEVKPYEIKTIAFSSPNTIWWPKELNNDFLTKRQPGLKLYKYNRVLDYADNRKKTVPAFFAIDWNSNTAYYWQYSS